jgi:hypothetical protein
MTRIDRKTYKPNTLKEKTITNRSPTQSSVKIPAGKQFVDLHIKKRESDVKNSRSLAPNLNNTVKMSNIGNLTAIKTPLADFSIDDYIDPSILNAFNKCPYTQSLKSY